MNASHRTDSSSCVSLCVCGSVALRSLRLRADHAQAAAGDGSQHSAPATGEVNSEDALLDEWEREWADDDFGDHEAEHEPHPSEPSVDDTDHVAADAPDADDDYVDQHHDAGDHDGLESGHEAAAHASEPPREMTEAEKSKRVPVTVSESAEHVEPSVDRMSDSDSNSGQSDHSGSDKRGSRVELSGGGEAGGSASVKSDDLRTRQSSRTKRAPRRARSSRRTRKSGASRVETASVEAPHGRPPASAASDPTAFAHEHAAGKVRAADHTTGSESTSVLEPLDLLSGFIGTVFGAVSDALHEMTEDTEELHVHQTLPYRRSSGLPSLGEALRTVATALAPVSSVGDATDTSVNTVAGDYESADSLTGVVTGAVADLPRVITEAFEWIGSLVSELPQLPQFTETLSGACSEALAPALPQS